jgi:hypothetical protein
MFVLFYVYYLNKHANIQLSYIFYFHKHVVYTGKYYDNIFTCISDYRRGLDRWIYLLTTYRP